MVTSTCIYLLGVLFSISSRISADESAPHSTTLKSNFKLKCSDSNSEFATSITLNKTLHSFVASMWLNCSSDIRGTIYRYSDGKEYYTIALTSNTFDSYIYVNGYSVKCGPVRDTFDCDGEPSHYLLTWRSSDGEVALYKDNHRRCFSNLQKGGTIKKGGKFTIGGIPGFSGEIAYLNVYEDFVRTTEGVSHYRSLALSDPDAVIPWEVFRFYTEGRVRILPEYDIFRNSVSRLICHSDGMELILLRKGFDFPDPDKLVLLDGTCGPSTINATHIIFYADLSNCGTEVTYNNASTVYHNEVRKIGSPIHLMTVGMDDINSTNVDIEQRRIGLDCHYNRVKDFNWPVYAPHINNIHNTGYGKKRFGYYITLYHSMRFDDAFSKEEYPINVEMEKEVFVEVAIASKERRLDTWITHCRATPSADYADSYHYDLISNGCPNKLDESIQYYNTTKIGVQRFSFQTFRFTAFPTAVVFLHCEVEFCDSSEIDTRCKQGLSIC